MDGDEERLRCCGNVNCILESCSTSKHRNNLPVICKHCIFKQLSECRRFPPAVIHAPVYSNEGTSVFPEVSDDCWCGEFKVKEDF